MGIVVAAVAAAATTAGVSGALAGTAFAEAVGSFGVAFVSSLAGMAVMIAGNVTDGLADRQRLQPGGPSP